MSAYIQSDIQEEDETLENVMRILLISFLY